MCFLCNQLNKEDVKENNIMALFPFPRKIYLSPGVGICPGSLVLPCLQTALVTQGFPSLSQGLSLIPYLCGPPGL